jgi:sulfur carrier protein ThiS
MSITVTVKVSPGLQQVLGQVQISVEIVEGASVADLLTQLGNTYPELKAKLDGVGDANHVPYNYFVNRKVVLDHNLANHRLNNGDRVHILVPVVGG